MIKVIIHNFQSIKDLELTIDGFTTILGETNIGKSSIVRAINSIFDGIKEYQLPPGENYSSVEIIFSDGLKIKRERDIKNNVNSIQINADPTLAKLNRKLPEDLKQTGFYPIKTRTKTINPFVEKQKAPSFLLSEDGTTLGEIISSLSRINDFIKASALVSSDIKTSQFQVKDFEKVKISLEEKEKHFKILPENLDDINNKEKELISLETQHNNLLDLNLKRKVLTQKLNIFSKLPNIILPVSDISKKLSQYKKIVKLSKTLNNLKTKEKILDHKFQISIPTIDKNKAITFKKLTSLYKKYCSLQKKNLIFDLVPDVPNNTVKTKINIFRKLTDLNKILIKYKNELSENNSSILILNTQIDELEIKLSNIKKENPNCPMCNKLWKNDSC